MKVRHLGKPERSHYCGNLRPCADKQEASYRKLGEDQESHKPYRHFVANPLEVVVDLRPDFFFIFKVSDREIKEDERHRDAQYRRRKKVGAEAVCEQGREDGKKHSYC